MTEFVVLVPEIHYVKRTVNKPDAIAALEHTQEYHKNMVHPESFVEVVDPSKKPWKIFIDGQEIPFECIWNTKTRQMEWSIWGTAKRGYGY